MNPFQWLANLIKGLPNWVKVFLDLVWDILADVFKQVTSEAYENLKSKITVVASMNLTNEEKFQQVWDYARKDLALGMKDSALKLLIEAIVSSLKNIGQI